MDWLAALPATAVTAATLLVGALIAQSQGKLYFKSQVDEIREDRDTRIAEARADRDTRVKAAEARAEEARADKDARIAEVRADRDARIVEVVADRGVRIAELVEERDDLKEALAITRATLFMQTEQLNDVLEASKTSHVALQSIARAGGALTDRESQDDTRAIDS